MDGQTSGTNEAVENQASVDPWVAAFAALEPKSEKASEADTNVEPTDVSGTTADTEGAGKQQELPDQDETIDSTASSDDAGGLGDNAGIFGQENRTAFAGITEITEESIQQYKEELNNSIREQAMNDIAQEFRKRNVRQHNGILGATLDDEDICKRDSDGVPHFYNPETGREFTGDNPRRQAQEWADDYNQALANAYNEACAQYEDHLRKEAEPAVAVMEFTPKYNKLDDIRRGMFDNVIEDYEITDNNGKVIGYNCDLDKALAMVERQISMIQNYAKQHQSAQQAQQPSGPALDMKTSSGAVQSGDQPAPTSLAEAMERLQNAELEKLKKN